MKKFFTKGLVALLPLVLTAAVLYLVAGFLYGNVGVPIGEALKKGVEWLSPVSAGALRDTWVFRVGAPIVGFCLAILLTLVAGFFVATFLGKKLLELFEAVVRRIPVIGAIYPYARQFTDFFLGANKKMEFKNAVAVPFPTQGMYSIGFVTGEGMKALNEATKKHMICVFVPTAPTPFSGFVVYVAREDVIPLPLSTEEAMRIIISAGVLHPGHQQVGPLGAPGAAHFPVPEDLLKGLGERPLK
jgi:uncharacterized membrane protein